MARYNKETADKGKTKADLFCDIFSRKRTLQQLSADSLLPAGDQRTLVIASLPHEALTAQDSIVNLPSNARSKVYQTLLLLTPVTSGGFFLSIQACLSLTPIHACISLAECCIPGLA
ncbi:hypothetical protein ACFSWD_06340, partial [Paenibacillus xanthanilyticus]